jgi:hypothetical protein
LDPYFCYIHRDSRPVAELKVLTAETEAGLAREIARLRLDYPDARFEIFQGDRPVSLAGTGAATESDA